MRNIVTKNLPNSLFQQKNLELQNVLILKIVTNQFKKFLRKRLMGMDLITHLNVLGL